MVKCTFLPKKGQSNLPFFLTFWVSRSKQQRLFLQASNKNANTYTHTQPPPSTTPPLVLSFRGVCLIEVVISEVAGISGKTNGKPCPDCVMEKEVLRKLCNKKSNFAMFARRNVCFLIFSDLFSLSPRFSAAD